MTDEINGSSARPTWRDLTGAIDKLRTDQTQALNDLKVEQKQDLRDMEGRLMTALQGVVAEFRGFKESTDKRIADVDCNGTSALAAHLEAIEISRAKSAGRTEFLSKTVAFVSTNWKLTLIALVAILAFIGNIDLNSLLSSLPH